MEEEGPSLLQGFLNERSNDTGINDPSIVGMSNALLIDVYLVQPLDDDRDDDDDDKKKNHSGSRKNVTSSSSSPSSSSSLLLSLAELAVSMNDYIQSVAEEYPWTMGGDGPVFTVHATTAAAAEEDAAAAAAAVADGGGGIRGGSCSSSNKIPHLRAACHYGASVADEWMLIGLTMNYLSSSSLFSPSRRERQQDHPHLLSEVVPTSSAFSCYEVAAECWDVDDGQVLLIESSRYLPEWVDRIGPACCRHRCWILGDGRIHLIAPPTTTTTTAASAKDDEGCGSSCCSLSLPQALRLIAKKKSDSALRAPAGVHRAIRERVDRVLLLPPSPSPSSSPSSRRRRDWHHRAAVAVPRSVARLVRNRPDLVAAAVRAFADGVTSSGDGSGDSALSPSLPRRRRRSTKQRRTTAIGETPASPTPQPPPLAGTCEDWVWTTVPFGRAQYAVLRTLSTESWKTVDDDEDGTGAGFSVPAQYACAESKRVLRQCRVESTPHVRCGLQLGVRLCAGLDYLLLLRAAGAKADGGFGGGAGALSSCCRPSSAALERRVLQYWTRIHCECCSWSVNHTGTGSDSDDDDDWLARAWRAGPNRAEHNLNNVMKCPVFLEEVLMTPQQRNGGNTNNSNDSGASHGLWWWNITPLSHPGETLAEQIRSELLRKPRRRRATDQEEDSENDGNFGSCIPSWQNVDTDESWMAMPDSLEDALAAGGAGVGVGCVGSASAAATVGDRGQDAENSDADLSLSSSPSSSGLATSKEAATKTATAAAAAAGGGAGGAASSLPPSSCLDDMLDGMNAFMGGTADLAGVAHNDNNNCRHVSANDKHNDTNGCAGSSGGNSRSRRRRSTTATANTEDSEGPIQINPTVFLNMLHAVLRAESANDLSLPTAAATTTTEGEEDPYFSKEDYDLMEPDNDNDDEDDNDRQDVVGTTTTGTTDSHNCCSNDKDNSMVKLMDAMDQELQGAPGVSRQRRQHHDEHDSNNDDDDDHHDHETASAMMMTAAEEENVHVLSNLLQSLEVSEGGPNPVRTILQEMGAVVTTAPAQEEEE